MKLSLPIEAAKDYSSPAQRMRVMTEEQDLPAPPKAGKNLRF